MSKIILIVKRCPSCGKGHMRTTGVVKPTSPIAFQHDCDQCGFIENYNDVYPQTGYEEYEIRRI